MPATEENANRLRQLGLMQVPVATLYGGLAGGMAGTSAVGQLVGTVAGVSVGLVASVMMLAVLGTITKRAYGAKESLGMWSALMAAMMVMVLVTAGPIAAALGAGALVVGATASVRKPKDDSPGQRILSWELDQDLIDVTRKLPKGLHPEIRKIANKAVGDYVRIVRVARTQLETRTAMDVDELIGTSRRALTRLLQYAGSANGLADLALSDRENEEIEVAAEKARSHLAKLGKSLERATTAAAKLAASDVNSESSELDRHVGEMENLEQAQQELEAELSGVALADEIGDLAGAATASAPTGRLVAGDKSLDEEFAELARLERLSGEVESEPVAETVEEAETVEG